MSHLHHKVSALIDGELSPHERNRALAHAKVCPQCRREIAETLEIKHRVNRLAPVDVSADLLDVVGLLSVPAQVSAASPRPTLMRRVFAGVGSFSAVIVALAYVVGAPDASQAKPIRPPVEEFTAEFADSTGLGPLSDPAVGGLDGDPVTSSMSNVTFAIESDPRMRTRTGSRLSAGPTAPEPAPRVTPQPGDSPQAVLLLRRAVDASQHVGFLGDRIIRSFTPQGVQTLRVEVEHVPGQGTRFDVLHADGHVQAECFVGDSGATADGFDGQPIGALISAYDLSVGGTQQVDGRPAMVVTASQGDQVRARFWIDNATGLLLRRALYDDGELVRWSGYSSITTGERAFMDHLAPELQTPQLTTLSTSAAPALNDKGWTTPEWLTEHFRLSFLHSLEASGAVMHAEYTDGVSTISVFEERGVLDASSLSGFRTVTVAGTQVYVKQGLPMVAVWESGGTVFTVVTDAPEQLAAGLIDRLPHVHDAQAGGVTTRIGHGLSRLASAVSP